jgi:hypothetical protein
MAEKVTRLTHKIAIKLYLVAKSCVICVSRSRRPVRKLLVTPSHTNVLLVICDEACIGHKMRFMEQIWSTVWNKADKKLFVRLSNSKHMYNTMREIVKKKTM